MEKFGFFSESFFSVAATAASPRALVGNWLLSKESLLGEFRCLNQSICSETNVTHLIFAGLILCNFGWSVSASGCTLCCSRLLNYYFAGLLSCIALRAIELEKS